MPFDWIHMARMAKPKKVHPYFIPDRASVYWLDYLLDPRPQSITDPDELRAYYDDEVKKFPSATRLSKPKVYADDDDFSDKSVTCHGVSTSALSYTPSNRIRELSTLSQRQLQERPSRPTSSLKISNSSNSVASSRRGSGPSTRRGRPPSARSAARRARGELERGDCRSPSPNAIFRNLLAEAAASASVQARVAEELPQAQPENSRFQVPQIVIVGRRLPPNFRFPTMTSMVSNGAAGEGH